MKRIISQYIAATALLALAGCYADIDLDKYRNQEGENLLVLNSVICPDSTIAACASRTWFYTDTPAYNGSAYTPEREYVPDLSLSLRINGTDCGLMTYDPDTHLYRSPYKPQSRDRVELSTIYSGAEVTAATTVPEPVEIEKIDYSVERLPMPYDGYDYVITYRITFTDRAGTADYYYLRPNASHFALGGVFDYSYDYLFAQLGNEVSSIGPTWDPFPLFGLPFTDHGIDGQRYTIVLKEHLYYFKAVNLDRYDTLPRPIQLYAITEDYYHYQTSLLRAYCQDDEISNALIDIGIATPTRIFSNIAGGVGILGSFTVSTKTVDIMPGLSAAAATN